MANNYVSGWRGKVFIGSTELFVMDFNLDWQVGTDDITHTGAAGSRVVLDNIESFDGTLSFVYDTLNKPTVSPVMKPRTFAVVHLKPEGSDDFSANCLFSKFSWKSGPKAGAITITCNVMSSGPITYPLS